MISCENICNLSGSRLVILCRLLPNLMWRGPGGGAGGAAGSSGRYHLIITGVSDAGPSGQPAWSRRPAAEVSRVSR